MVILPSIQHSGHRETAPVYSPPPPTRQSTGLHERAAQPVTSTLAVIGGKEMRIRYLVVALFLTACGTTGTKGVVSIGPDLYMIGSLGNASDYSGSAVKARLFQQASQYCQERNRVMVPTNSTAQDGGIGTYASAEVQFRCVPPDSPEFSR